MKHTKITTNLFDSAPKLEFPRSEIQNSSFSVKNFPPSGKPGRLHLRRYHGFVGDDYDYSPECLGAKPFLTFATLGWSILYGRSL